MNKLTIQSIKKSLSTLTREELFELYQDNKDLLMNKSLTKRERSLIEIKNNLILKVHKAKYRLMIA